MKFLIAAFVTALVTASLAAISSPSVAAPVIAQISE